MQAKEEATNLELKFSTAKAQLEAAKQEAQTYRVSHVCLLKRTGYRSVEARQSIAA